MVGQTQQAHRLGRSLHSDLHLLRNRLPRRYICMYVCMYVCHFFIEFERSSSLYIEDVCICLLVQWKSIKQILVVTGLLNGQLWTPVRGEDALRIALINTIILKGENSLQRLG